ncbi:MAG: hypothetical protein ACI379_01840 [Nocardioides sp.]|uniref:hypothetical protein n=1 Tax=Nocardioides sp. TaxID=35761 RepID=UPI003F0D2842
MTFLVVALVGVGLVATAAALGHRTLMRADSSGAGIVDALANFTDVFEPARARASRDLKDFENAGPVTPVPDDDDDVRAVRVVRGPDGRPRAARVRRSPLTPPG